MNVLIIEKNSDLNDALMDVAMVKGHLVFQAENEKIGREILEREKIDVVVADLSSLGFDGEYLALLNRFGPQLPIIVMRGFNPYMTNQEIHRSGAAQVLDKPFDFRDFVKQLDLCQNNCSSGFQKTA